MVQSWRKAQCKCQGCWVHHHHPPLRRRLVRPNQTKNDESRMHHCHPCRPLPEDLPKSNWQHRPSTNPLLHDAVTAPLRLCHPTLRHAHPCQQWYKKKKNNNNNKTKKKNKGYLDREHTPFREFEGSSRVFPLAQRTTTPSRQLRRVVVVLQDLTKEEDRARPIC